MESFGNCRGIGKTLMKKVESHNPQLITLDAQPFTGCELFYKSQGFTNSGLYIVNEDFDFNVLNDPVALKKELKTHFPLYYKKC